MITGKSTFEYDIFEMNLKIFDLVIALNVNYFCCHLLLLLQLLGILFKQ